MIILAGQHVLVESCVFGLGSCATPVVLERGVKDMRTPLAHVVVGPDSIRALPRPR
jgi:hypothetical protein